MGSDNGAHSGSGYSRRLKTRLPAFALRLTGPFVLSRDTGLTPCPGSLESVLRSTSPDPCLYDFRTVFRVYERNPKVVNRNGV
jgi:hypothetical protein